MLHPAKKNIVTEEIRSRSADGNIVVDTKNDTTPKKTKLDRDKIVKSKKDENKHKDCVDKSYIGFDRVETDNDNEDTHNDKTTDTKSSTIDDVASCLEDKYELIEEKSIQKIVNDMVKDQDYRSSSNKLTTFQNIPKVFDHRSTSSADKNIIPKYQQTLIKNKNYNCMPGLYNKRYQYPSIPGPKRGNPYEFLRFRQINELAYNREIQQQNQQRHRMQFEKTMTIRNQSNYQQHFEQKQQQHCAPNEASRHYLGTRLSIESPEEQKNLYKCSKCNQSFKNSRMLMSHHNSVHKEVELFKCSKCLSQFAEYTALIDHQKICHDNYRP